MANNLHQIELANGKMYITTHTHNRFTALLDFVLDYPDDPVPER